MHKLAMVAVTTAMFGLMNVVSASAQQSALPMQHDGMGMGAGQQPVMPMQRGSQGMGAAQAARYDPDTVETIRGEVVAVEQVASTPPMMRHMRRGAETGIHLTLRTGKETVSVILGPAWYLDNQSVKIAPKDKVVITGSRITFDDQPTIVAATVAKGGQVLRLRDASGVPLWAGRRQR